MKQFLRILIVTMSVATVFNSCNKDEEPQNTLAGSYIRIFTEGNNTYQALLTFTSEGIYHWVPVGDDTGHTASSAEYSISGNTILIFNDSDCETDAVYGFELKNGNLTLTADIDECDARKKAMEGNWHEKS